MNKRILKLFNEAGFHQPEMERLGIEEINTVFIPDILNWYEVSKGNLLNFRVRSMGQGGKGNSYFLLRQMI